MKKDDKGKRVPSAPFCGLNPKWRGVFVKAWCVPARVQGLKNTPLPYWGV